MNKREFIQNNIVQKIVYTFVRWLKGFKYKHFLTSSKLYILCALENENPYSYLAFIIHFDLWLPKRKVWLIYLYVFYFFTVWSWLPLAEQ